MKRSWGIALAIAIVAGITNVSLARETPRVYEMLGVLTDVAADDDATTSDTFTFLLVKGNNAAYAWQDANPGDIIVGVDEQTTFTSERSGMGHTAGDFEPGDGVRLRAQKDGSGGLVATSVTLVFQHYTGTVVEYDDDFGVITIEWDQVDDLAAAWLAANGEPNPVSADRTPLTLFTRQQSEPDPVTDTVQRALDIALGSEDDDGMPRAGDNVLMLARVTEDNDGLEAVDVITWR